MHRAVTLARKGEGFVNPNPLVGAVLVKNGVIISEGWHRRYGGLHAEAEALRSAPSGACKGADLYVTLEPCCHQGKQPPCTDAIIRAGIKRVFIGSPDPNPLVNGCGIAKLKKAGIIVVSDVLRSECDALNPVFFHYITTKTPYVIMKYAMTADGLTACSTGDSRWVSGPESRNFVQKERSTCMAVLVGVQTVIEDDPLLTCRIPGEKRQPVRIVCDTHLRIPVTCRLVQTAKEYPLCIACSLTDEENCISEKVTVLEKAGVSLIRIPERNGSTALFPLMEELGRMGIDSVLLEGGGKLNCSALEAGIVQKIQVFISPEIFGSGGSAHTAVTGGHIQHPSQAVFMNKPAVSFFGSDVLLEYDMQECV
ncbi:MAG: bifunctional diaminohydroxyphosphoribosylaminopyrimidine deaminase/5-amino-6-(5-phosphoribosylamino)uracil reductase RibD [Treponema sp.]|nr:bifunctional diaminohydroxyphosphoribosylaminopyrimidine deaminase/5-amino-6-(5-phosphoribosylamino)uracil reductase RibD [Treponema sp.]